MQRILCLVIAAVVSIVGPCAHSAAAPAPASARPNIVVVLMDNQRWDELGCTGHPFVKTPNIDRIARAGAKFENAFVTTPDNAASRTGFFTGRHPNRNAVSNNPATGGKAGQAGETFSRRLQEAGYRTAFIGQWPTVTFDVSGAGFDEWVTVEDSSGYNDPQLRTNGRQEAAKGYLTDILSDRAVQFIEKQRTTPFSLVFAPGAATTEHMVPAERHKTLYSADIPRRRPNHVATSERAAGIDDEAIRNRWRMLAAVDEGIGRILRALENAGQLETTVIVFTSDQGHLQGEHGLNGEGRHAYDEAIQVPLLISYPKASRPGATLSQLVLNIDLAPTLLEFAQAAIPADMQGQSLVPVLRGNARSWRVSFLIESFGDTSASVGGPPAYQAVRTVRMKYIRSLEADGAEELYDNNADRYEMINLAGRATAINELRRQRAELAKLLKSPR